MKNSLLCFALFVLPFFVEAKPVQIFSPGVPSNLMTTVLGTNAIRLEWDDNTLNETGFLIERSEEGNEYVALATYPENTSNGRIIYDDTTVLDNTTYYYRVSAIDSTGKTPYSNVAIATTEPAFYIVSGKVVDSLDFLPIADAKISVEKIIDMKVPPLAPNAAIPDGDPQGYTQVISVADSGVISDVNLRLKIDHAYPADLVVTLVHPDGTTIKLLDQPEESVINTVIPREMPSVEPLSILKGKNFHGDWKLIIADASSGEIGSLELVQLFFSKNEKVNIAVTDSNGYYQSSPIASGVQVLVAEASGYTFTMGEQKINLHQDLTHINFIGKK